LVRLELKREVEKRGDPKDIMTVNVRLFNRPTFCLVALVLLMAPSPVDAQPDPRPDTEVLAERAATERAAWSTSRLQGTPDPPLPYRVQRVFPARVFRNPVFLAQEPGSTRVLVAQLDGKIYAFDKHDDQTEQQQLFLDVGREIYSFSFHPNYVENGQFFTFTPKSADDSQQSAVSRWTTRSDTEGRVANADSEQVIIQWPSGGHNGGEAIFGPDGMMYISTGDGSGGSDPPGTGQGVNDLLSVIMRIDVDRPDDGQHYSVPHDNPFRQLPDARPEIWAFGFRNPWRMSFHPDDGTLYVGDVGQDLWEMIWIARRGGNYGWSVREGSHDFHPHKPAGPGPILPPLVEHPHIDCRSITGGYVYRGSRLPELDGVYLYGDYQYGKIWGLRHEGDRVTWQAELADSALQIPSFALGRDGEFWVLDHLSGEVHELVKAEVAQETAPFPRWLSETGLFADTVNHVLAPGVARYSVNTPQWLEGAHADRFFGLPPDTTIRFVERSTDANTWGFADGAVTAQTILLPDHGTVTGQRRMETRIMVKQQDHWLGYSYLWNEEQTDAELVGAAGIRLELPETVAVISEPDGSPLHSWHVPSRTECMVCHSRAAGFVLGLNTLQMNRPHKDDTGLTISSQLERLSDAGYFHEPLPRTADQYDALPNAYDESADIEKRARAYLHVNCSMCHVSDGGGNARFQVRYDSATADLQLLDEPPIHGDFSLGDARLIARGAPAASVLFYRLSKTGSGRMPHVGAQTQDVAAIRLIHDWIARLGAGEPEQARPPEISADNMRSWFSETGEPLAPRSLLLESPRRALELSHALTGREISHELRRQIARLAIEQKPEHRDLFERFLPDAERTRRLGENFSWDLVLNQPGDVQRGHALFHAKGTLQCANCHQIAVEVNQLAVGPPLLGIGTRYSNRQILEALVNPSLHIAPEYRTHVAILRDGRVLTGLVSVQDTAGVSLRILQGDRIIEEQIPSEALDELVPQTVSLMPDNQLRDLTAQQAADLVAFLASLKTEAKP
jgi:uncharacterized repeat protein (TIGR03806 family)